MTGLGSGEHCFPAFLFLIRLKEQRLGAAASSSGRLAGGKGWVVVGGSASSEPGDLEKVA